MWMPVLVYQQRYPVNEGQPMNWRAIAIRLVQFFILFHTLFNLMGDHIMPVTRISDELSFYVLEAAL